MADESAEHLSVLGDDVIIRASGGPEAVNASLIEEVTPPGGGPPLHRHSREDEVLYVLEGELRLWLGSGTFRMGASRAVLLPRGIVHTFRNEGETPSRVFATIVPAGFEGFFREVAERGLTPPDADALAALAGRYGLEVFGPPPG